MNSLELAKSMGLELPSPWLLAGMLIFSVIGWIAWRHGRKTERSTVKWLGLALMLYQYATPQTWLMYSVGTALTVWVYFAWSQ